MAEFGFDLIAPSGGWREIRAMAHPGPAPGISSCEPPTVPLAIMSEPSPAVRTTPRAPSTAHAPQESPKISRDLDAGRGSLSQRGKDKGRKAEVTRQRPGADAALQALHVPHWWWFRQDRSDQQPWEGASGLEGRAS